jgi:hypothetical protein
MIRRGERDMLKWNEEVIKGKKREQKGKRKERIK